MQTLAIRSFVLIALTLLGACSQEESPRSLSPEAANLPTPAKLPDTQAFAQHLPNQAFAHLSLAVAQAEATNTSIETLLKTPTEANLNQVRQDWRASYSAYLAALASIRLPLVEPPEWRTAGLTRIHLADQINSWPIEPGYIDYVEYYPLTGIVNDTTLPLTVENIASQHRFSDASYVSMGYPALEFLLWGESGTRPASDFDQAEDKPSNMENAANSDNPIALGIESEVSDADYNAAAISHSIGNQGRRGIYLQMVNQLLLQHLQRLQLRWEPSNGYYAGKVGEINPTKTLQASLMTVQKLVNEELLQRYLANEGSSPFSAGNNTDLAAVLGGIRELFLPQNADIKTDAGLAPLLTADQLVDLQSGLAEDSACGSGWLAAASHTAGREACRQQLQMLLATLNDISQTLGLGLPTH